MALQFRDSCDIYASASDFTKRWASATPAFLFNATGGRFGGGAITSSANTGTLVSPSGLRALTDGAIGFSFKGASKNFGATTILTMLQSTGVTMNALQVNTSGFVTCQHPSVTGNINICDGAYHWVEMRFVNATGGWLYVDGVAQGT